MEGSSGVCGVKGVLGRERKTRDRSQICSSQQMYGEVETSSEFLMAAHVVEVERCRNCNVAGSSLEFECLDDGQDPESASWSARVVANVICVKKPPWMEMDQWWRHWHRTGHRWIEKCNMNVLTAVRERMLSWQVMWPEWTTKKSARKP